MKKFKIAIAGSTAYTRQMAEALMENENFEICWILTPSPKKIGRKQILTSNPLDNFAQENKIKSFLIQNKIEKDQLLPQLSKEEIDFLLVVDFGYFVPNWLLKLAKIAPLNIHPSALPKWRGSSPGQFVLLFQDYENFGGKNSAVTLMEMNNKLDQGPIIHQEFFEISDNWDQTDYYQAAFDLMAQVLAEKILSFAKNEKKEIQANNSPTPTAGRIKKEDLFLEWKLLKDLINDNNEKTKLQKSDNLLESILADNNFCKNKIDQINFVKNACKAFYQWPNLWTIVPTNKGQKRMKILSTFRKENNLVLDLVQIEGKNSCLWREIKNFIS